MEAIAGFLTNIDQEGKERTPNGAAVAAADALRVDRQPAHLRLSSPPDPFANKSVPLVTLLARLSRAQRRMESRPGENNSMTSRASWPPSARRLACSRPSISYPGRPTSRAYPALLCLSH